MRNGRNACGGAVEVLWCDLSARTGEATALAGELSPAERARAARFRFPRDRDLFMLRRAWRRRRLGEALGVAPSRVRFDEAPGRPHVLGSALRLSTASSSGVVVLALCWTQPLGIDVEKHDPSLMVEEPGFFPHAGLSVRFRQADAARTGAYFDRWAEVEARCKLRGDGLPGFDAAELPREDEHLTHLSIRQGFSSALCTPAPPDAVRVREAAL